MCSTSTLAEFITLTNLKTKFNIFLIRLSTHIYNPLAVRRFAILILKINRSMM